MDFKAILKAMIALLVPFLFQLIIVKWPDFPLTAENVTALILWLVGFAIGGWQVSKSFYVGQRRLYGKQGDLLQ